MIARLFPGFATLALSGAPAAEPTPPTERESFGAVELRWQAPSTCPRSTELRARVERDATTPLAQDLPLSVVVDATVTPRPDGRFTMHARTASATGATERTWIADTCETLTELTVVLLESAIEQTKLPTEAQPDPDPDAESDAESESDSDAESESDSDSDSVPLPVPLPVPRSRGPSLAFRPSLGAEIRGLPRAGLATSVAFVVAWPRIRLEVLGLYASPRVTAPSGGAGAVLQLASVAVRGCGRLLTRWIELPMCAGLEAGAVIGRGVGVDAPRRDQVLWAAALLGPGLVVRAHPRLGIVLDGHVAFPLGRPTFTLDPVGTVWRAGIGGRVLLGVEVWLR